MEGKIYHALRKFLEIKALSADIYSKLYVSGSCPGILYGLLKIHKQNQFNLNSVQSLPPHTMP